MTTDFADFDALRAAVGTELGPSDWITIDQQRIDQFAAATGDHQWIHVDAERAAAGPYGATIAHGFLTLSLMVPITAQVMSVSAAGVAINYGLDRVRFLTPVPVGSRVRGRVTLTEVTDVPGGVQVARRVTIELEGAERPACVAEAIARYLA
ncbi:MaoC family dehydratase [Nocardia sp. NPDC059177]|uniref:MaoC family dehydratase n=1 Tax=Nocardia sp. NPDC059177 TaxID=3346759 RepID=UPI0036B3467F